MKLEGISVLVTGGAGFIGSHLVDALQGCRVRVLDDFSTGTRQNLMRHTSCGRVELVEGDVRNPSDVQRAIDGVSVVFHLACRGVRHSIGNPRESHEVNAAGTLTVLEAARAGGVKRLLHVSSSEVYGTARRVPMDEGHPTFPETVYGAAKLAGESYARAYYQTYGLPTVVVRPFNNFGPRSHYEGDSGEVLPRFVVWALNGREPVIFGDGRQTRDFIYVEDTARWLVRTAECDSLVGQTINLGSGRETSVGELADIVYREVTGRAPQPDFQPARPGDVRRHLADVERARQALSFQPQTPLAEGVRRLIAQMRALPGGPAALLNRVDKVNWTGPAAADSLPAQPSAA